MHARDELGMTELSHARPFQAAGASAASFTAGAMLPLLAVILAPSSLRIEVTMAATVVALAVTGWAGARRAARRAYAGRCALSSGASRRWR